MSKLKTYFMTVLMLALCASVHADSSLSDEFIAAELAFNNGDYQTALAIWTELAEKGDAESQNSLGAVYGSGSGVVQNDAESMRWYTLAAQQGHILAQFNLGNAYYRANDFSSAFEMFLLAAEGGYMEAQYNVGHMSQFGEGTDKNPALTIKWFTAAAEQGHMWSQNRLARIYKFGLGTEKDFAKAFHWYLQGARQGDSDAQLNVGTAYNLGEGVVEDHVQAFQWYKLAAENGEPLAQLNLGRMYHLGRGVMPASGVGAKWMLKAYENGIQDAAYYIGILLLEKNNVIHPNGLSAGKWLEIAANDGDSYAQFLVGKMYMLGLGGLSEQPYKAFEWFQKSAAQGNREARNEVVLLNLWAHINNEDPKGVHTPRKLVEALQKGIESFGDDSQLQPYGMSQKLVTYVVYNNMYLFFQYAGHPELRAMLAELEGSLTTEDRELLDKLAYLEI